MRPTGIGALGSQGAAPLLEVHGVTLQYKTRDHLVTATYRVSFDVYGADRFVLLGPSGCGKSTLLKAIGGFMPPVEGEIRLSGKAVAEPGPDRMMVFQEFDQLLPWKTVQAERDVLRCGPRAALCARRGRGARARTTSTRSA